MDKFNVSDLDPEYFGERPGQFGTSKGLPLGRIDIKKQSIRNRCNFDKATWNAIRIYDCVK